MKLTQNYIKNLGLLTSVLFAMIWWGEWFYILSSKALTVKCTSKEQSLNQTNNPVLRQTNSTAAWIKTRPTLPVVEELLFCECVEFRLRLFKIYWPIAARGPRLLRWGLGERSAGKVCLSTSVWVKVSASRNLSTLSASALAPSCCKQTNNVIWCADADCKKSDKKSTETFAKTVWQQRTVFKQRRFKV